MSKAYSPVMYVLLTQKTGVSKLKAKQYEEFVLLKRILKNIQLPGARS